MARLGCPASSRFRSSDARNHLKAGGCYDAHSDLVNCASRTTSPAAISRIGILRAFTRATISALRFTRSICWTSGH